MIKVRIYLIVFAVVGVLAVVDAARADRWTWLFLAGGLILGALVGIVASRMQRLDWDEFEHKAVGKFDAVGVVVLILYIVFSLNRSRITAAWVPAQHAPATSLAVLAGAMLGQVLGVRRGLVKLRRRLLARPEPNG